MVGSTIPALTPRGQVIQKVAEHQNAPTVLLDSPVPAPKLKKKVWHRVLLQVSNLCCAIIWFVLHVLVLRIAERCGTGCIITAISLASGGA